VHCVRKRIFPKAMLGKERDYFAAISPALNMDIQFRLSRRWRSSPMPSKSAVCLVPLKLLAQVSVFSFT